MPTKTFDASWGSAPGYAKEPMLSSSQLEQLAELLGRPRAEIERAIAETLKTLWLFKYTTPPLEGSQRAALGQLAKKADWLRRKLKELDPAALRKLLTEYEGG